MPAYYNEIDPYAAQWLRNLITEGLIPAGEVDDRSIVDVRPADLAGYGQCHFFAGLGGWAHALRLAGVPDEEPIWTGSCPCQPFSVAGKRRGFDDERHLWPEWFRLIRELGPPIVFGEQVARASVWVDAVFSDLEAEGYACGAAVLPAASVGAPHKRERLWFVAHADELRPSEGRLQRSQQQRRAGGDPQACAGGDASDAGSAELWQQPGRSRGQDRPNPAFVGVDGAQRHVADADEPGPEITFDRNPGQCAASVRGGGQWPAEPDICRVAHGVPARVAKLRALGNAIVPQVAAEFIRSALTT